MSPPFTTRLSRPSLRARIALLPAFSSPDVQGNPMRGDSAELGRFLLRGAHHGDALPSRGTLENLLGGVWV